MLQAAIVYIYSSNKSATDKSITTLTEQNRLQALDIERLKSNHEQGARHDERVLSTLDKLSDRLNKLSEELSRFMRRSGEGGSGPGEYRFKKPEP